MFVSTDQVVNILEFVCFHRSDYREMLVMMWMRIPQETKPCGIGVCWMGHHRRWVYTYCWVSRKKILLLNFILFKKKAIKVLSILAKHRKCFDLYILLNRHIPLCFYRHWYIKNWSLVQAWTLKNPVASIPVKRAT